MKTLIYWFESNFRIHFYMVLNIKRKMKNLLVRTKFYWFWAGGPVLIVRTVVM